MKERAHSVHINWTWTKGLAYVEVLKYSSINSLVYLNKIPRYIPMKDLLVS